MGRFGPPRCEPTGHVVSISFHLVSGRGEWRIVTKERKDELRRNRTISACRFSLLDCSLFGIHLACSFHLPSFLTHLLLLVPHTSRTVPRFILPVSSLHLLVDSGVSVTSSSEQLLRPSTFHSSYTIYRPRELSFFELTPSLDCPLSCHPGSGHRPRLLMNSKQHPPH